MTLAGFRLNEVCFDDEEQKIPTYAGKIKKN